MTRILELLERIRRDESCLVEPPAGQPLLNPSHALPDDLREFYELCGGVILYRDAPFCWVVSSPTRLVPTNLELIGEQVPDDITASWYIIARERDSSSSLISIDLGMARLGWCYDSFYEVHGVAGSCAVLAHSFTDLLIQLIDVRGEAIFWEEDEFVPLGDAYD